MRTRHLLVLAVALPAAACHDAPTSAVATPVPGGAAFQRAAPAGTGIVLNNVTSTPIPLLGNVVFNGTAVITQLALNAVGGLQASGTLTGTIGALGQTITQNFTTDVVISGSGNGNSCSVITVDLAPINVNVLGQIVAIDLTAANANVGAQGPLGSLLCSLTSALNSAVGGAVSALLRVINGILGGSLPAPPA